MKRIKNTLAALALLLSAAVSAQTSQNMTLLGSWDDASIPTNSLGFQYSDCWGYANATGEYAIMGSSTFIHIFNVTNPANPVEVFRFPGGTNTGWREFRTYSHYLYAVTDQTNEGLRIFDLNGLPNNVTQVLNTTEFFTRCHTIHVDSVAQRLYCAGTNTRSNGLIVLSLANPAAPTLLASVALAPGNYVHDCYVRANKVYASHGNNGLYVWNFANPAAPVLLGSMTNYVEKGYNHSAWMNAAGTHLVMCDETHGTGVKTVSVSDLGNITVVDTFRSALLAPTYTNSIAHNPCVRGDFVYLSYYHDGIQVWDISNPADVQRVGYYDTETGNTNYGGYAGPWGIYPYLPSGNIVGADVKNGLFMLDLTSDCRPPTTLAFLAKTANGFKADWNTVPGATQYRIRYRQLGTSAWTVVTTGSASSKNITYLSPGTTYEVQMASKCAYGWTGYAQIRTVTTLTTGICGITANAWVGAVTPTTATVTWNRVWGGVGYQINHRKIGASTWKVINVSPGWDTSHVITGLQADKTYEVRVATKCTSTQYSPFSVPVAFTTPASLENEPQQADKLAAANDWEIAIYPNPASEELHIVLPNDAVLPGLEVEILDAAGRPVHAGVFDEENHLIFDLEGLPAGVYACRVRAGANVRVEQVVKM